MTTLGIIIVVYVMLAQLLAFSGGPLNWPLPYQSLVGTVGRFVANIIYLPLRLLGIVLNVPSLR